MKNEKNEQRKDIKQLIANCTLERLESLRKRFYESEEYKEYDKFEDKLFNFVNTNLGEEGYTLVKEFDDKMSGLLAKGEEYYYKSGLEDAFMIMKVIRGEIDSMELNIRIG